ncbi:ribosome-associated protein [Mangrovibacterium marinum]|uniref:Ribosome-associated protein n=1 Tax=Mangrovibacterium marinum TaxID=1639118 RepID=A0A2T5C645_9BACT|nr:alternative ribosome rescue aminoacyl-tRNA hydrolase ArfB [Mangrovibacterium marinum]PTN10396.1 ribosome-associated protein [Mangrovibacterium marinum]
MESKIVCIPDLSPEFVFQASRSSGPGGQNVNKVNSRVELRFDVANSILLSEVQKTILLTKLAGRITSEGILILTSQEDRSQLKNKELVVTRFYQLLREVLKPVRKRRKTRPTRASVEKRLQRKKQKSERKSSRGKIRF